MDTTIIDKQEYYGQETFRLSNEITGSVWHAPDGWHGCLDFGESHHNNFVGPFVSVVGARMAVRSEFVTVAVPIDQPIVRGL